MIVRNRLASKVIAEVFQAIRRDVNALARGQIELHFEDARFVLDRIADRQHVLEIPTPRHSTLDAIALGLDATKIDRPWWIQERAYTSPVWYRP